MPATPANITIAARLSHCSLNGPPPVTVLRRAYHNPAAPITSHGAFEITSRKFGIPAIARPSANV
jgi:hypothetical protein